MTEVYIENQKADVSDVFSTLISYSINDIKDFSASSTSVSKTVVMPGSNINNKIFGSIFDVTVSNDYNPLLNNVGINFNAAMSARVIVFQDNFQVLKGTMQLLEITIDNGFIEYEVAFFGELSGFVAKLGNLKLEDMDFSAYDHIYNLVNIDAYKANAQTGIDVYYPLIDYGKCSVNKHDWDIRAFRPTIAVKEYIDRIFAMSGYSYECDVFQTTLFKSIRVPHNQKKITALDTLLARAVRNPSTYTSTDAKGIDILFNTLPTFTNFSLVSGKLVYSGAAPIVLDLNVTFFGVSDIPRIIDFSIKQNATQIAGQSIPSSASPTPYVVGFGISGVTVNPLDEFVIHMEYAGPALVGYTIDIGVLELFVNTQEPVVVDVNLGDTIQMNSCIPKNILQKDFISSILKMYNMYVFEDKEVDKTLFIKPFIDYYVDAEVEDWSLKIDRQKAIKLKPMSELNSRYYHFAYKDDSDYWNDLYKKRYNLEYGGYIYDSQYEFAKETQKVEIMFSGTPLLGYNGEDKIYSTIFKRTGDSATGEEGVDSNIRLLYCKLITGVGMYRVYDGVTGLNDYTEYPYAGHLDDPDFPTADLNFGVLKELFFRLASGSLQNNMFNLYWATLMAEITDKDSKMMTVSMKLTQRDIYNLDFSKLIYVDGSVFRLNKITDYNAKQQDTCSVELLKVINKIY